MILADAKNILTEVIRPCGYDEFFDKIVGRQPLALLGGKAVDRSRMLGSEPKKVLLDTFEKYAPLLTCHIHTPTVPPPTARPVTDANEFMQLISEYHQSGYTVRIPDLTDVSDRLSQFTRALELLVENPVGVVVFWSAAEAKAPVHHDEIDVIVIQLTGTKRWFISDEPATFPNKWTGFGQGSPSLGPYSTYDVQAGDLLYLPRGTAHTVESTSESIHLSIGFVPVTIRDGINAALDLLSDLNRPLRANIGVRADNLANNEGTETILEQIRRGLEKLTNYCQSDPYILDSLLLRRARMISDLPKIASSGVKLASSLNNRIKHNPLAFAQLVSTPDIIDFRQPGEQILIHAGAEESMRFIIKTSEFRIADIPGDLDDDIRLALVNRLLNSGFLELVD